MCVCVCACVAWELLFKAGPCWVLLLGPRKLASGFEGRRISGSSEELGSWYSFSRVFSSPVEVFKTRTWNAWSLPVLALRIYLDASRHSRGVWFP